MYVYCIYLTNITDLTIPHLKNRLEPFHSIVEYTSFGRMKARDAKFPVVDLNGSFFRKGEIGDWKNMASPQLDALMDGWIKEKSRGIGITFKYEWFPSFWECEWFVGLKLEVDNCVILPYMLTYVYP